MSGFEHLEIYILELLFVPAGLETELAYELERRLVVQYRYGETPARFYEVMGQVLLIDAYSYRHGLARYLEYGIGDLSVQFTVFLRRDYIHAITKIMQDIRI